MVTSSFRYFDQLRRILKPEELARTARETGFRLRTARKVGGAAFFWSFVLGAVSLRRRSVAGVARLAGLLAFRPITRQGIQKRATWRAVRFFQEVYGSLAGRVAALERDRLPGKLAEFEDVNAFDSTTIRLVKRLRRLYPACRSNVRAAALKIHAVFSLTLQQAERLRLTAERVHDRKGELAGQWVRKRLVLFDLGYFDYGLFGQIVDWGGAFLSRLKSAANGTIVAVRKGCLKRCVGGRLNGRIYEGRVVDLDAAFGAGRRRRVWRVIGLWNRKTREYHWYVTSLSPKRFSPDEIAAIYGLRWQIELFFKTWKSQGGLDEIDSEREEIVLVLVYATLCAALLARLLLWLAARRYARPWYEMCLGNAMKILAHFALHLGRALLNVRRLRHVLSEILETLAVHAWLPARTKAVLAFNSRPR